MKQTDTESPQSGGGGMINQGSTCYAIATLHLLRAAEKMFFTVERTAPSEPALSALITSINPYLDNPLPNPIIIRDSVERLLGAGEYGRHQDAAEYLNMLIANADGGLPSDPNRDLKVPGTGRNEHNKVDEELIDEHIRPDGTVPLIKSRYVRTKLSDDKTLLRNGECNKFYKKERKYYEYIHSLPVVGHNIQDAVNHYLSVESVHDPTQGVTFKGFEGLNPEHKQRYCKQLTIDEHPEYLLIQLMLFEYTAEGPRKTHHTAHLNRDLTFGDARYELKSVVVHYGEVDGGHYVNRTYISDGGGEDMYQISDDNIVETKTGDINSNMWPGTPYIMLYVRKNQHFGGKEDVYSRKLRYYQVHQEKK